MRTAAREIDTTAVLGVKITVPENSPADLDTEPITVEMELQPGAESILHIHPHQEERYEVLAGTVDLFLDGKWHQLAPGQSLTIPKGSIHAFRNSGGEVARAINTHAPGLRFVEYLLVMEDLIRQRKVTGLKGVRNSLYLSLHGVRYEREVLAVRPPRWVLRMGAWLGKTLGLKLE